MTPQAARPVEIPIGEPHRTTIEVVDGTGAPLDCSGWTSIVARARTDRDDPAPLLSYTVDDTELADGVVYLDLTGEDTTGLEPGRGIAAVHRTADGHQDTIATWPILLVRDPARDTDS